jgi:phage I-like protein
MAYQAGYWVDLFGVTLNDDTVQWIQAMPLGSYEHPVHGTIEITSERVQRFAANVNDKVRGQDLDIDYDHKNKTDEAAGWVRQAESRPDGLWLAIEWTKAAAQKIKDKAYRYFSPEFVDEWKHPKTQQTFQDVLFGGGITNRPFLKDILPINMSELLEEPKQHSTGGTGMDPKELRTLLGLPEDATDAKVTEAVTALKAAPPAPVVTPAVPVAATEPDAALKKLMEDNPTIKALVEGQKALQEEFSKTKAALRLSEASSAVNSLTAGKDYAFPAVVLNELPAVLVQLSEDQASKVTDLMKKLADTGLVPLKEKGHQQTGGSGEADPVKAFVEAVAKAQTDNPKLDYTDAVDQVSRMSPKLFQDYHQATYAGREN